MVNYYGPGIVNTDCPYYKRESRLTITCEGTYKGTENCLKFETEEKKIEFQKKHCFEDCERCVNAENVKAHSPS